MEMRTKEIERELRASSGRSYAEAAARAAQVMARRAAAGGLVDVAYAETESPFGTLLVASTPRGLVRLAYPDESRDEVLEDLARKVSPRLLETPERLLDVRRQLDEYFDGHRTGFELEVDWALSHGFVRRVLRATARIPYGEVGTYRVVAGRAGNVRAVRAAGNALGSNPLPIVVPCHRVVRTDGSLGGYTGGVERKEFLLQLEGVLDD
jgi:methylated-DNA-[protein]-cysteine S-methyltransferase